jgi:ferritin-like metal-binding protein YciE
MQKTKQSGSKKSMVHKMSAKHQEDLEKILEDALKDIYWAEKHLVKALPKMAKAAADKDLSAAFEQHLRQTEEHVSIVERVFELIGKKAQAKKCDAMEGLVKEGETMMQEHEAGPARDAGLIMSAQKVEHYEIASYGSMVAFAETLGMEDAADLLTEILNMEKETDVKLSNLSDDINVRAAENAEA